MQARGRVVDIVYLLGGQLEVSASTIMVAKTLTCAVFAADQVIQPAFRPQKFMLRTKTTLALSASARTVTRTPATAICVPSRCSENQGPPSEIHRVCLLRSPSLEAADAAVPSQWPLQAPVEQRLIYQASGASRVVLRHEEEYLRALFT